MYDRVRKLLCHITMGAFSLVLNEMAAFTIALLVSFFAEEKRSITRGKNHYRSDHIEIFAYADGVIRGTVHASMKKKSSKMTVSSQ